MTESDPSSGKEKTRPEKDFKKERRAASTISRLGLPSWRKIEEPRPGDGGRNSCQNGRCKIGVNLELRPKRGRDRKLDQKEQDISWLLGIA